MSRQRSRKSRRHADKLATQNTPKLQTRPFTQRKFAQPSASQTTDSENQTIAEQSTNFSFDQVDLFTKETTLPSVENVLQAKLTIGQPGDKYEQEADRIAGQMVQHINRPQMIQQQADIQQPLPISQVTLNHSIQAKGDANNTAVKVQRIVCEQLGVTEELIKPESSFVEDLGADSLDTVELVMAFEEEFDTEISDEAAERITTVQAAIDYINEYMA